MLTFAVLARAGFIVFAVLWLREMPRRWRSDWQEIRTAPEPMDRVVIGAIWLITLYLLVSILGPVFSATYRALTT